MCNCMKGTMTIAQSKIRFEETFDPFPSGDVLEIDDSCLGTKYHELSKDLFGETEEGMITLIKEFKEAAKKEDIEIPGCKINSMSSSCFKLDNNDYFQTRTTFVGGFFVLEDVMSMRHSKFFIVIYRFTKYVHITMKIFYQWEKMTRHIRLK